MRIATGWRMACEMEFIIEKEGEVGGGGREARDKLQREEPSSSFNLVHQKVERLALCAGRQG